MIPSRRHVAWLLCLLTTLFALPLQAQTLDELTVTPQDRDTVARLTFNGSVRFVQQTPTTPADLYRITVELVAADESVLNQSAGEVRDFAGAGAVPAFKVSYTVTANRRVKLLTLELARKVAVRVRQGPRVHSTSSSSACVPIQRAPVRGPAPRRRGSRPQWTGASRCCCNACRSPRVRSCCRSPCGSRAWTASARTRWSTASR
jgi:hypothetical protein